MAAGVAAHLARQRLDGLLRVSRHAEPTLDGLGADLDGLARRRVWPGTRRQGCDARCELARHGRSREQTQKRNRAQRERAGGLEESLIVISSWGARVSSAAPMTVSLNDAEKSLKCHLLRDRKPTQVLAGGPHENAPRP